MRLADHVTVWIAGEEGPDVAERVIEAEEHERAFRGRDTVADAVNQSTCALYPRKFSITNITESYITLMTKGF